jgi:GTP-binding protein HflX
VLVEDALFATLDPTVRRAQTPDGRTYTLSDTVGFVRHLPHQLVEAFRSTLEEVVDADLILHVVDASDRDPEGQLTAVREVLAEIGATKAPELVVVNKTDAADPHTVTRLLRAETGSVAVSARTGAGIDELQAAIEAALPRPEFEVTTVIPYDRGDLVSRVFEQGDVLAFEHVAAGTRVHARVGAELHTALGLDRPRS